jgi:hypothetical protein
VKVNVQLGIKDAARARSTCFHLADPEATIVSTSLRNEAAGAMVAWEPFTAFRLARHHASSSQQSQYHVIPS